MLRNRTFHMAGRLILPVLALVMMVMLALPAAAATPTAFSVRAELPDNQIDAGNTYFDLLVAPGGTQTIRVAVSNTERRDILARVELNPASNAQNGLIVYSDPDARDESLALSIHDVARVPDPELRVAAGATGTVDILLELPEQPFEGVILGGVSVTAEYADPDEDEGEDEGIQVENRYAYVIGLKLRQSEEPAVEPEFHLVDIRPGLVNYRQALLVNLRQSEPVIAGNLTVSALVTRSGDEDFHRRLDLDSAQMAPSSTGDFVIDWRAPIEPGTYRLNMRVDWRERSWEWDEEFVIAGDEAQSFNSESVIDYTPQSGIPAWVFVLVGLMILIILLLLLLLLRRAKRDRSAV